MPSPSKKPAKSSKQMARQDLELFAELVEAQPANMATPNIKPIKIEDEIARSQKIRNDDAEQDITLKKTTLQRLFALLYAETAAIFIFALLQATRFLGFRLDEWSFKLLVSVTIAQITAMLFVAINYLFPKNRL